MFKNIYKGKKVLITGHTGFKGSWLTSWLLKLGAEVHGFSVDYPSDPSMFLELKIEDRIHHHLGDVRDKELVHKIVHDTKPDFVFHLAAQALVSISYSDPVDTIETNVMGTANMLDALRTAEFPCTAIFITSDKCYENVEWVYGYKETDQIGGRDIYSGSKGAAEVIFHSYYYSFFKDKKSNIRLASARAGNVIGGGDWAKDRLVPDCMKAWSKGGQVTIRSPKATRPWQHVMEPLSGYLNLGMQLSLDESLHGESFNFGPRSEYNHTVLTLLKELSTYWKYEDSNDAFTITDNIPFHEAGLLKLNCDKALFYMKWQPTLDFETLIKFVGEWYYSFYKSKDNIVDITNNQIEQYENLAIDQSIQWAIS